VHGSAALDLTLLVLSGVTLGLFATAHVAIVVHLLGLRPRWRAGVALLVPPFALVWGRQAALNGWCRIWVGALALYVLQLTITLAS
jgi:hypothetical protein